MKIITLDDGTRMTCDEYRSMCLRDAQFLAAEGDRLFRVGRYGSVVFSFISIEESLLSLIPFNNGHFEIYALGLVCAAGVLVGAITIRSMAAGKLQSCLQRRQSIMDSLDRITKAFEEIE